MNDIVTRLLSLNHPDAADGTDEIERLQTLLDERKGNLMNERTRLLADAEHLVNKDRNDLYGPPTQDFERTSILWSAYLGKELQAHDVAALMILLKLSRIVVSPENRDHWLDIAGYSACGFETVA